MNRWKIRLNRRIFGWLLILAVCCVAAPQSNPKAVFDTAPAPRNGLKALQQALIYPESARKAGFEGKAVVKALISADGTVLQAQLAESSGDSECDRAAVQAIQSIEWQAARLDDQPVEATVFIPIQFRLSDKAEKKIELDQLPRPVGGMQALQKAVVYPELMQKSGSEGMVRVRVLIDSSGSVKKAELEKSMDHPAGDEAALQAVKAVEWKPGRKGDQAVEAWVTVPIQFRIK